MTQQEHLRSEGQKLPMFDSVSRDFAAMGKQRFEEIAKVQSELFDAVQEANKKWLDRLQSETALASDITSKLAASRSISDTTAACQEWAKRRMELLTEDGKQLMTDSQKLVERTTKLLSSGWPSNGRTGAAD